MFESETTIDKSLTPTVHPGRSLIVVYHHDSEETIIL